MSEPNSTNKKIKEPRYNIDLIVEQIIERFGTQRELAKVLGTTEANVSNKLKNPSKRFVKDLERVGISVVHNKNVQTKNGIEFDSRIMYDLIRDIGEIKARLNALERKIG